MSRRRLRSGWPAVAELYVRRAVELADCEWWCADACDAVAAEISAVQNISHARAVGQVQFACALWHRLPAVAQGVRVRGDRFSDGLDDHQPHRKRRRRVSCAELDEAIARHCRRSG